MASSTRATKIPKVCASFGVTDVGRKRDHNEDNFIVVDELGLYAVADGMGGHAAGEVASAKAVQVMRDFIGRCQEDNEFTWPYGMDLSLSEQENTLATAIKLANREVWRLAQEKPDQHGMGTTIVSVSVLGYDVAVAHVGDSRAYRVHNNQLFRLTEDHSWVNEQLRRGIITPEEAKNHRWQNVITRALGNKEQVEVEVNSIQAEPGDMILLCSDGLDAGRSVDEMSILQTLLKHQHNLSECGRLLIGMANEAGGSDNISVIVLRFFASEEEAAEASRDAAEIDTNPVLGAQQPDADDATMPAPPSAAMKVTLPPAALPKPPLPRAAGPTTQVLDFSKLDDELDLQEDHESERTARLDSSDMLKRSQEEIDDIFEMDDDLDQT